MLKKIGVLLTLIVFLCAGTALAAPKKGGTLIFGRGGDSVGLDPAYETEVLDHREILIQGELLGHVADLVA